MASVSSYKGRWVDVNMEFGEYAGEELVYGSDAIKKRLKSLILCPMKSVPFRRSLGTRMMWFLFESAGTPDVDELRESLFQSIRQYIPEIELDRANSRVVDSPESGDLIIYLRYMEKDTGLISNYQIAVGKLR